MQSNSRDQNTQVRIRKVGPDDMYLLKKVVARAFAKDPFVNWMVVQDEKRTKRIELFCETATKHYALQYDHLFRTEDYSAMTIWLPPEPRNCWNPSTLKDLRFLHKRISITGIRQMPSRLYGNEVMKKHHLANMKEPHYYLSIICVAPEQQGKGIGSHLVQDGLRMCNEKGVPAYLETAIEEDVRFFRKHDFRVIEEFTLPKGPKIWTMIYKPK